MMQKVKFGLFIALFMFSMLAAEDFEQKISRSFDLTAGGSVELANINGRIEISTRSKGAVEVLAVKRSNHKGAIENIDVIFEFKDNQLKVSTKYKKDHIRAKVDYKVVVPEKLARAAFKSVNGGIECQGVFAGLSLKSVNGRIKFSGDFVNATLSTVNGGVEVSQETMLQGDLSVETVNGGVDIELNRKSAFDVEGSTVNGGIHCDFPVTVERHFVGKSLNGKVNGGGPKLTLETVNGGISISKI